MPSKLQLPSCKYKEEKETSDGGMAVKAKLYTGDDCSMWIKKFGALNTTKWIVKSTKRETRLLVCRRAYVCHNASPRKKAVHKKKTKKIICPARVTISIYKTDDEYPAFIRIYNNHSHSTDNNEALSSLPASSAIRAEFDSYFNIGMKIAEALKFHALKLKNENANLSNASIMPGPPGAGVQDVHRTRAALSRGRQN